MAFRDRLLQSWHTPNYLTILLWPLSLLYRLLFLLNRACYSLGLKRVYHASVPVIVVGNVSVGGTGKTPLVIYLVEFLREQGYAPGVISRGYQGEAVTPVLVSAKTPASQVGDEPALIVRRTGVPLCIGSNREQSIEYLLSEYDIDIVISDDGLQHFALARDVEICLLDDTSPMQNTSLLPAGPLREPLARAARCDLVVTHGGVSLDKINMHLQADQPLPVGKQSDSEFDAKRPFVALAAIGNPERFFRTCRERGYRFDAKAYPDHYHFSKQDIDFGNKQVLMTEKDAVKCQDFADSRHWYLPVSAKLTASFDQQLLALLHAE